MSKITVLIALARIFHEDFKTSDFGGFAQHLIIKSR